MSGKRAALIVATDNYEDPDISQLRAPGQDAEALGRILANEEIGAFEVTALVNEPAHEVRRLIEGFFAERKLDDTLLLYFSGHGMKDEDGKLYFVVRDTQRKLLRSTGIAATFVHDIMERCRSRRQILIIDSCYSGAFAKGMQVRADEQIGVNEYFRHGRGRAVVTASNSMQYAFEGDELKGTSAGSVFTRHLIQGLESGEADRDNDGRVSFDELYDYLHDRVTKDRPEQVPEKWVFGVEGELIIARNPNPRESVLPTDLREALTNSNIYVRKAALEELGELLRGDHPGLAKAAEMTLEGIAREDDSRALQSMAAELLGIAGAETAASVVERPAEPAPPEPAATAPAAAEHVPDAELQPAAARARQDNEGRATGSDKPPGGSRPVSAERAEKRDQEIPAKATSRTRAIILNALVWVIAGTLSEFVLLKFSDSIDPAATPGTSLAAWGAGILAVGGLCAGVVNGLLSTQIRADLPRSVVTRVGSGWMAVFAAFGAVYWSNWFWDIPLFLENPAATAGVGALLGFLGGANVARATSSTNSWRTTSGDFLRCSGGWALGFYCGVGTSGYLYLLDAEMSSYLNIFVSWVVIASLGSLAQFWPSLKERR